MLTFIVLGTSAFTLACAEALLEAGADVCGLITLTPELLPLNSVDVAQFARTKGIECFETPDINSADSLAFLSRKAPDYIFSTWPRLIDNDVLKVPNRFVIGSHPTALPRNRGRHPLHWAIDLGLTETMLSFFVMDEGIDSGDILLQVPVQIDLEESIADLNNKVTTAARSGIPLLLSRLLSNGHTRRPQAHAAANYWRKRTPFDVVLDFRMDALRLSRAVRSYLPPYPGAMLVFEREVIRIVDVAVLHGKDVDAVKADYEPGKVLAASTHSITVKSADEIVRLTSTEALPVALQKAKYIHPPSKYFAEAPETLKRLVGA